MKTGTKTFNFGLKKRNMEQLSIYFILLLSGIIIGGTITLVWITPQLRRTQEYHRPISVYEYDAVTPYQRNNFWPVLIFAFLIMFLIWKAGLPS